jgi:hypothetical protein
MHRYSLGATCNVTATSGAPRLEIRAPATAKVKLIELHLYNGAATASIIGIVRANAIGVTPTSPVGLLPELPDDLPNPSSTLLATAWGTAPTLTAANALRRVNMAAAIGSGIIWTWGADGLVIPASGSLIVFNVAAATAALDYTLIIEE